MTDLVVIFCEVDDFCKEYEKKLSNKNNLLTKGDGKRAKKFRLNMSEVITISIWYHFSGYKTFKEYYHGLVLPRMRGEFPNLVSYSRFIELKKIATPVLALFMQKKFELCSGVSFIDSFKLAACNIRRKASHKTLKMFAKKGKTSMGWFYGTKAHVICNDQGSITALAITPGNVSDNNHNLLNSIFKKTFGKVFGDKGYIIKQDFYAELVEKGIKIFTRLKKNMKNKLLSLEDKLLLKKRGLIESVGDILKNHMDLEHTRHRAPWAFFCHVFSTITAYQFRSKKPHLDRYVDFSISSNP